MDESLIAYRLEVGRWQKAAGEMLVYYNTE